jgi:glycosyltransferase involved in cell wall biosynthesis
MAEKAAPDTCSTFLGPMLSQITPLILTLNEEPNLPRTLRRLDWAARILVVDSFSTDRTCEIAQARAGVTVVQRAFDTFANQCNFGLQHIHTPWVLSLDADYVLSSELVDEIQALKPTEGVAGYSARFKYCVHGHPLRASLYPPRVVLYRRGQAQYRDDGHGHRVRIDGPVAPLRGYICHDDRKPFERWLREQNRYADIEAEQLQRSRWSELNLPDRVRQAIVLAPPLVFFHCLLGRRLLLDGWPGWHYAFQRALAECILSLKLAERKFRAKD